MKQLENRKNGFTLVEVIIVLVILAILAAIMIPALTGWIDDAKEKICVSNRSQLLRYYEEEQHLHYLDLGPDGVKLSDVLEGDFPETEGDVKAAKCPSGGVYSASLDGKKVNCSKHGVMGALNAGSELAAAIQAMKKTDKDVGNYDSTAPETYTALDKNGNPEVDAEGNPIQYKTYTTKVLDAVPGLRDTLANGNVVSWRASGSIGKCNYFWTDQDISTVTGDNTWVRAMKYNETLGTYTAGYIKVTPKTNVTFDLDHGRTALYGDFNQLDIGNWVEAKLTASNGEIKQTDDGTKKDFDVTEAFYESLSETKDGKPAG